MSTICGRPATGAGLAERLLILREDDQVAARLAVIESRNWGLFPTRKIVYPSKTKSTQGGGSSMSTLGIRRLTDQITVKPSTLTCIRFDGNMTRHRLHDARRASRRS